MQKMKTGISFYCLIKENNVMVIQIRKPYEAKPEETEMKEETVPETEMEDETIPETEQEEAEKPKETRSEDINLVDGMRPEFKEAMDSYEEFVDEYCDFMKKYAESDGTDVGLLADYTDYMSKYSEFVKKFEAWDNEEMNTVEATYYLDVQTRVSKKLLEVI